MAYNPQNPNGQASKANSAPVVLANDQVGVAGTAATDVMTIQGIAGMTPVAISGTVTSTPSGTQTVSATDFDIRDLVFATDKVDVSGSSVGISGTLPAFASTPTVTANAGTGDFTVVQPTASNLNATVVQGTATNLKTQAEVYQGGTAVSATSGLFVDTTMHAVKTYQVVNVVGNNAFRIKDGASKVYGWYIYNNADVQRRVVLYDSNTNPPSPGTSTIRLVLTIPSFSGANASFPFGIEFVDGLGIATLIGMANSETTGLPNANELNINIFYK